MAPSINSGMNRKTLYWLCNAGGWLLYVLLYGLLMVNRGGGGSENASLLFIIFFFGLFFSHLYRLVIVRFDLLRMNVVALIPRLAVMVLIISSLIGFITVFAQVSLVALNTAHDASVFAVGLDVFVPTILGYILIFVLWTLIYFAVHYFLNYKSAEIENLKWQASMTEIELNKLKSQLNPHFVFNCMNSIRALVDEDPEKAKEAVTQLSSILRNTLMMGRSKVVPFAEELKVVKDYLGLEAIRLEERLRVKIDISPACLGLEVPPLMVQTLVENAIKHGIAQLTNGGLLEIKGTIHQQQLHVEIRNSGHYKGNTDSETGFGIRNTQQRLSLLYGERARFTIKNESAETVLTELIIPIP
jgi:two-component system LytT family sensor kinase